jgi:hypothetical protein
LVVLKQRIQIRIKAEESSSRDEDIDDVSILAPFGLAAMLDERLIVHCKIECRWTGAVSP